MCNNAFVTHLPCCYDTGINVLNFCCRFGRLKHSLNTLNARYHLKFAVGAAIVKKKKNLFIMICNYHVIEHYQPTQILRTVQP